MALDVAGLVVLGQRTTEDGLVVDVQYAVEVMACPYCGRPTNKLHDKRPQAKRDVPLRGQKVSLILWRRRFRCLWCTTKTHRPRSFSEPNLAFGLGPKGRVRRTTGRLREQIGQEAMHQTVKRVAKVYGVGERFVRECFGERAGREIRQALAEDYRVRVLGMDEFSMKRGVRYQTVFCDLQGRRVLEVVEGRDMASVQPYLEGLKEPERVEVAVIDMSETYRQVVNLCLPQARVVVDRFHAIRRVGEALDRVRLRLQRRGGEERKGRLYRLRYALLREPEDWTEKERKGLEELFLELPELKKAWELKEDFRGWYEAADRAEAEAGLEEWEKKIREAGIAEYKALFVQGSMLGSWREELLNYFDHRYTNGYTEGKNTRTKQLQRQAYGYRNSANLRLRILCPAA